MSSRALQLTGHIHERQNKYFNTYSYNKLKSLLCIRLSAHIASIDTVLTATTQEDMIRLAAILASVLDPTGIANVIASYAYPTCNKLFST